MGDDNRLKTAQWILERTLAWNNSAEVKVGVIVALDTAMLAALGTSYNGALPIAHTAWAYFLLAVAAICLFSSLFCAAMTVLPRLDGPKTSMVFFGRVAKTPHADYIEGLKKATDDQLLEDWSAQIHRNAEIACEKFGWVRAGML